MNKFDELQAEHERLLAQHDRVSDETAYLKQVTDYITRVCEESEWVSVSRDRDQLRANLRYWASFVYDKTGTYPKTTMRPARQSIKPVNASDEALSSSAFPSPPQELESSGKQTNVPRAGTGSSTGSAARTVPPPEPSPRARSRLWLGVVALASILALVLVIGVLTTRSFNPTAAQSIPTAIPAGPETGFIALNLTSKILTAGPSPFDPNQWAARVELVATGGNGEYIYWVNNQPLPDLSPNQVTVEGTGCESVKRTVGVTSDGQAASTVLVIPSPLPNCPQP